MNNQKHYAAAVVAFVTWGFFSLPLRALIDYSPGVILFFRILFSFAVLAIVMFAFRRGEFQKNLEIYRALEAPSRKKTIWLTLGGGLLLTVNWLTFIYVVNEINVKTASFSYLVCPVITALLGYVLLKEKLSTVQWLSVFLCAVSCAVVGMNSALELGFSFLTAFTYALYLVSQRRNQGFDRILILGIQVGFSLLILSVFSPLLITEVPGAGRFYSNIIVIAVFFTVIPLFLNLFALNKINSATIGILMYLNPLINFTVAFAVFNEQISTLQLIGYALILVALVIFNLENFVKVRTALLKG